MPPDLFPQRPAPGQWVGEGKGALVKGGPWRSVLDKEKLLSAKLSFSKYKSFSDSPEKKIFTILNRTLHRYEF